MLVLVVLHYSGASAGATLPLWKAEGDVSTPVVMLKYYIIPGASATVLHYPDADAKVLHVKGASARASGATLPWC